MTAINRSLQHLGAPAVYDDSFEVRVLFPNLQIASLAVLLLVVATLQSPAPGVQLLYVGILLLWFFCMAGRLALNSWRRLRICSLDSAASITIAGWHVMLGVALGVPAASSVALLILVALGLYGMLCHES